MFLSKFRALALAATFAPAFAYAQDSETAYMRLHLASELRFETQNMARLTCYIGADFNPEPHRAMLQAAVADFETTLKALKDGDEGAFLPPEANDRVLTAVRALTEAWPDMAGILAGGTFDQGQVAVVDLESLTLLRFTENLSNRIAVANNEVMQDLPLIMLLTVDMAGRQIMRTEKAAKEACLIGSGINVAQNRQNLQETVTVFTATMEALSSGLPGMIVRPPSLEIEALLKDAMALWEAPKAALTRLYTSGDISAEDRMVIGMGLEAVVAKLSAAAALYQSIELDE